MKLDPPKGAPAWMFRIFRRIERALSEAQDTPFRVKSYAFADLPAAADWPQGVVYVANEAGGAVLAFSDGTNWRRVTDRAIVS